MSRKRKKKIEGEGWARHFDWSIDPQTGKEIFAIIAFALAAIYILGVFGAAGTLGNVAVYVAGNFLGLSSFLVPIVFLGVGLGLWKARAVHIKAPSVIGFFLMFVFVPAMFINAGGYIGQNIWKSFSDLLGEVAGYITIFVLAIASILLATNNSFRQLRIWIKGDKEEEGQETPAAKVSVFQAVRDKLSNRQPQPSVPVSPLAVNPPRPKTIDLNWIFPPLELLSTSSTKATSGNITKNIEIIQKSLKDFGVTVSMGDVHIGPTVTQYTLKPAEGVKLNAITARGNDISLALAAHPIRIEAPIPGKAAVGIEIPNKLAALVTLREILESDGYKNINSTLRLPLGRDVAGAPFIVDLKKMPHLLFAGATGSGKSVAINSVIISLLYQNSPADLRIILVDPKRVEFSMYNGIPNLLTGVVTETDKTINTLRWTVAEMERRYKMFSETHKRNIDEYNANPSEGHIPYIVVIIDELADLMAQSANEAEAAIVRLAQMARATGIHLIVATQRPSVDVITGLIKANITTRIAFAVASQIDSRTILDQSGAEKLLGNGDMLYLGNDLSKPKRVQGVLVSEKEIKEVTDFLKKQAPSHYEEFIQEYHPAGMGGARGGDSVADDTLFDEAKRLVVQSGKASASLLQRRLRVGYARAARLLDILEQEGIIGPPEGAKPRAVLVGLEAINIPSHPETQFPNHTTGPSYYQPLQEKRNVDAIEQPSIKTTPDRVEEDEDNNF